MQIKVHATTVTATDCIFRRGEPKFSKLFTGLTKPKNQILGSEFAGVIEAVGKEVKLFKVGDKVIGTTPGYGSYSEYICLPEEKSTLAKMSSNKSYEEAIACCDGFITALPFLRDRGRIQKGNNVLIIGASGSVGSAAVQLAKYFGAEVTGVCSTSSVDLVKSIGAKKVIDYTKEDFTESGETYDIIFDLVGKTTFTQCKNSLKENGKFLEASITLGVFPSVFWSSIFSKRKAMVMATGLRSPAERTKDLIFISKLLETGKIKPVIDRKYPFEQIAEAHKYVDIGHKKGNVVINVSK
ncbi:MAG: NAD(P)-dependent alcohol dehydrogenase [Ignavibacteriaceae bacterium]|nr:NAD(P)-dependent alcohol dehydrogenase [Ignavibacteriaceae bacterium]MCW8824559.1 NAD(P)-dependent alcohol dehydrogenase [Ignavibacteriaceae bacterium]